MQTTHMPFDQVNSELEAWGSEGVRAIYRRQGAGENQFGVMPGEQRRCAYRGKVVEQSP